MPGSSELPEHPNTHAAAAALSVATRFCSPALLNHSIRSYLWGAMYARAHGIAFDDELYYVSALLHDVGLTEPFDSHSLPFEEAGGNLAWAFGVAAGWPEDRAARAEQIIDAHMAVEVSAAEDAESHLLQVATSWDVVGRRPEEFPEASRGKVLDRYPRLDFGKEFLALFEDQAERKPSSVAAQAVESGGGALIAANPLDAYSSQP
jgi:HD domain